MLRSKDTINLQVPKLTEEETEIIKQLGFCGATKKLLQVFCMDCKALVSIETFIQAHSSHSVIENDVKNAKVIFKTLNAMIDLKFESRVKNLQGKIRMLGGNLKDLQLKKNAAQFLLNTESQVQKISERLRRSFNKVENWIERHESESFKVLNVLNERVSNAEKQFSEFIESIEKCSHMNPIINNYNLADFSHFLDGKINNDQGFKIHEVPKASTYSKKVYLDVFCDIASVILNNLMQTFEVYSEELDFADTEKIFIDGLKKVFLMKNSQFEKNEQVGRKFEFVRLDDVSCCEEKKNEDCVERTRKPEESQYSPQINKAEQKILSVNNSEIDESGISDQKSNKSKNYYKPEAKRDESKGHQ